MSLLIVAPTTREARAIGSGCQVTGTGEAGERALAELLQEQKPDTVLIAGLCGGLDPSLRTGDLILAREVLDEAGEGLQPPSTTLSSVRRAMRNEGSRFVCSRLVTVAQPVATRDAKRDLWNVHGAAGADMETAAFARVATENGADWMALRAIIDPAAMSLPGSLHDWGGEADFGTALRMALRPQDWLGGGRLALALWPALRALRAGTPIVARVARDTVPLGDELLA
ncbi:MAG: hypothetical protein F4Y92_00480 [Dehalococcoidia bacterium]|nr:hypothetical protein [Dehalococcoidia bacterium]